MTKATLQRWTTRPQRRKRGGYLLIERGLPLVREADRVKADYVAIRASDDRVKLDRASGRTRITVRSNGSKLKKIVIDFEFCASTDRTASRDLGKIVQKVEVIKEHCGRSFHAPSLASKAFLHRLATSRHHRAQRKEARVKLRSTSGIARARSAVGEPTATRNTPPRIVVAVDAHLATRDL